MIPQLWLLAAGLIVLLLVASAMNLSLRTRTIHAVVEHLQKYGRDRDLNWLTRVRDEMNLATAALRTMSSLVLVLDIMAICEWFGLTGFGRDATAFAFAFIIIVVFGVAIPTTIAKYSAGPVIAMTMPAMRVLHVLALPLNRLLDSLDSVVRRLLGAPPPTAQSEADQLEREILGVVSEGEMHGAVDEHEKEMIESVIEFGDTDAEEIMTPRTDIDAIEKSASLTDVKKVIKVSGHSRIPVFDGTIDNILGVIYAKDLLNIENGDSFDITKTMRTVPYIPNNKPVSELLQELREKKVHIAIVLDEYGGTSGLVTIEDIIEELVGEIADEYEPHEPEPFERVDEHTVEVDARMRLAELNDELNIELPEDEDYDTIGGFVFSSMGKIPRVGEECRHQNVQISVIDAEARRINRLRVCVQSGNPKQPAVNKPN